MSYIGRDLRTGAFRQLDDISSGFDGSDTTHTMQVNSTNVSVGDVNQILLSLGGVIQKPGTDFTVSGSTLTFTTAPAANTSFFAILLGSDNGGTVTPTDGSVTGDKLASNIAITTSGDISFDGGSFVFNESSADKDFRIESNGKANMFFVDGGNDKIGINSTGSTPSQVTIEDVTGNGGGTLGLTTGTSGTSDNLGRFHFGNATDGSLAAMFGIADGASDAGALTFRTEATGAALEEALRIDSNRKLATNGETASDTGEGGLCLNQAANDDKILTLKSSDVAHGQSTGGIQTDTYLRIQKESSASGGCLITGITESGNIEGLKLAGYFGGTSGNTGKSTSQASPLVLQAVNSDGSGDSADLNSNENMVCILNRNTCRFIFDADGDFHADSSSTTFDAYEDAHLVRAYDLSHGKGVIDSKFDKFVSYNHEKLADLQLVGREDDGTPNHFINVTGMQRLHNGAIWQQYEKHQRLAEAVYEMAKEALGKDKADAILEKHDIKLLN